MLLIIIATRYSTASSVNHFFSTRENHTLIWSVAVLPTCSAIWYLTLLFLPKPDKHVTFGTVHCIWGGSDSLKTFRSQIDFLQHDEGITLKLQPEFQAPVSTAHELWLSFYSAGQFCAFGRHFIIEAGTSRSRSRSATRSVQRRFGLPVSVYLCKGR